MTIDVTSGGPFNPGDTVPFEVAVTNVETDDAIGAEVVVTLPAGFDPRRSPPSPPAGLRSTPAPPMPRLEP